MKYFPFQTLVRTFQALVRMFQALVRTFQALEYKIILYGWENNARR